MVSGRKLHVLKKCICKFALLLKKHFRKNIGIYLFAKFLEMLVMHKLVGTVIARQRAIIARRIRAIQEIESQAQSLSSTARLGTQNRCQVDKVAEATLPNSENGWKKILTRLIRKRRIRSWVRRVCTLWLHKRIGFYRRWTNTTVWKSGKRKKHISKDCPWEVRFLRFPDFHTVVFVHLL